MNTPKTIHITCDFTIDVKCLYDDDECKELEKIDYEKAKETIITGVKENIKDIFDIMDLNITVE